MIVNNVYVFELNELLGLVGKKNVEDLDIFDIIGCCTERSYDYCGDTIAGIVDDIETDFRSDSSAIDAAYLFIDMKEKKFKIVDFELIIKEKEVTEIFKTFLSVKIDK